MAARFQRLIKFVAKEASNIYFADLGFSTAQPKAGTIIQNAYQSFDELCRGVNSGKATVDRLLAPLLNDQLPIYCVGLNYRSHAAEAGLAITKAAPLWTKPCAALAAPDEDIPISSFCAANGLDWEGELVFVTSETVRDMSPEQASDYILGYTVGNDLSCRLQQMQEMCGGQFFYSKAFDKFAPIGPVLESAASFGAKGKSLRLVTRVNGEAMQDAEYQSDMIWTPAELLSRMSQGTTIPGGTAVMTGTPKGVGVFKEPRTFLKNGDVVEVELAGSGVGVLRNKMVFE